LFKPIINILDNPQLDGNEYCIKSNGAVLGRYKIKPGSLLCINPGSVEYEISGEKTKEPAFGLPSLWIRADDKEKAEQAGYTVCDPQSIMATHIMKVFKRRACDLLSMKITKEMLDDCGKDHPLVVEEVLKCLSVSQIQKVLKNLLKENVSIRSIDIILETLVKLGQVTKDTQSLTYADQDRNIHVLTLEPSLEQKIYDSGAKNSSGDIFSYLEPPLHSAFIRSLGKALKTMWDKGYPPVILCTEQARYSVRTALERELSEVAVLSVNEIDKNYSVESVGIIEVETELISRAVPVNEMDILTLLEKIYIETHECGIVNYQLEGKDYLDYVSRKLGINPLQAVLFSHFLAKSDNTSINIGEIADSVKCNKVKIIKYRNEINELENKRLIRCKRTNKEITYRVPPGVSDSLSKNIEYKPIETTGLSIEKFFYCPSTFVRGARKWPINF